MGMTIFWLIAFVVFAVGEGITVGLVSIWFAVGALGGLATAAFGGGLLLQIGVFLGLSALTLLLFKPLSSKLLRPKLSHTNADRVIGETAVVTEAIDNELSKGQVRVGGQIWTARSAHGVVIPVDTQVRVLSIEGVKVLVEKL